MKKVHFLISLLLLPFNSFSQQNLEFQKEATLLISTFNKNHYCPKALNNEFSEEVFNNFLKKLDPKGLIFTQEDIKTLSIYKLNIDDELSGKSWKFLSAATNLYRNKLTGTQKIYNTLLSKPLNFTVDESFSYSFKKTEVKWAANETELIKKWNKWLKYQILWQASHSEDSTSKSFSQHVKDKEPSIREKLKIIETRNTNRILNHPEGFEKFVASEFFNTIAAEFDPHSQYLSKTQWQNFESTLSTDGYSFGFYIDENDQEELVIDKLVPGGPAWKSNELHKGDVLLTLQWEGKETIDLLGADLEELHNILEASNQKRMNLTVKKATGQIKTVSLLKEKIREEDNVVKSFVLSGKRKIGYISLPGFYSEWENSSDDASGCSNDVAKEIVKLQKENIEGLILDIRYNGGGSLLEGMNLAGIFINEGPLFIMKSKNEKPLVVKDLNRGTVYDGPLVLMVNGQSASASELLASTLQDYNRALIVGSSTYGKATGQIIMSLDSTLRYSTNEALVLKTNCGLASVTTKKLYRITGKTAQLNGVQPNITLPDFYDLFDYKESSYKNPLASDSANKKVIFASLPQLPVKTLEAKSQSRVTAQSGFTKIKEITQNKASFNAFYENIPLTPEGYKTHKNKMKELWKSIEDTDNENSQAYKVSATDYDKDLINIDTFTKEINEGIISNIKESIYIEESFYIISDLIELQQK